MASPGPGLAGPPSAPVTKTPVFGAAPFPKRHRPYYSRRKTGCQTCRGRRKKCDERKPVCLGCQRNKLQCSWSEQFPSSTVDEANTPGTAMVVVTGPEENARGHARDRLSLGGDGGSLCARASEETTADGALEADAGVDTTVSSITPSEPPVEDDAGDLAALVPRRDEAWHVVSPPISSSIPPALSFIPTALSLTPTSNVLLSHYLGKTCNTMASRPPRSTILITHVVPQMFADELLMHVVLAMSGTHLDFRHEATFELRKATSLHYGQALRSLRQNLHRAGEVDTMRLALIMILLCYLEAIEGDVNGSMCPHLLACRQLLVADQRKQQQRPTQATADDMAIRGFVLEAYAYVVIVSNITPYGVYGPRTVPLDSFVSSLERLEGYDTFGSFFGGCHALFELIPAVALFGQKRLAEEEWGCCSDESLAEFQRLSHAIASWESPPPDPHMASWAAEYYAFGDMYRHALFIFLKAGMCGSVVSSPKTICEIQEHVDTIWPKVSMVSNSPFGSTMMWPTMIVGSCLLQRNTRASLRARMEWPKRWRLMQVVEASRLLTLLWQSNDARAYGPYGLAFIMKQNQINFGMT